jgi:hypothetical protein
MIRLSCRGRDALLALAFGTTTAFALNFWFNIVAKPQVIDSYLWLALLQEPGSQTGGWLARVLHPIIGYPWNVRLAVTGAYGVLVGMWALIALAVIAICRTIPPLFKTLQRQVVAKLKQNG